MKNRGLCQVYNEGVYGKYHKSRVRTYVPLKYFVVTLHLFNVMNKIMCSVHTKLGTGLKVSMTKPQLRC